MINYDQKLYYRVNPENNMMLTAPNWEADTGTGDSLWRTGMAYIAYGDKEFGDAIKKSFRKFKMINFSKDKYWYQGSRYANRHREDDVSRDQLTIALAALKLNDHEFLKDLATHLPYRLSRRFYQTPTLWFWIRSLVNDSAFNVYMFHLLLAIELAVSIPLTKLLRRVAGLHKYSDVKVNKETIKYKVYDAMEFPGYAAHLNAWQLFTVRKTWIGNISKRLLLWMVEDRNLLVRLLMNTQVTDKEIENYNPRTEWRWSGRDNGDSDYKILKGDELNGNLLDKDILKKLKTYGK